MSKVTKVTVSMGMTINIDNFQFIRLDVSEERRLEYGVMGDDNKDEVYKECKESVKEQLTQMIHNVKHKKPVQRDRRVHDL
jgi:hypothetical protein